MKLTVWIFALLFAPQVFTANATAATATSPTEINWFKGDLPAALKEAEATGKPLLVYWGASWCPPCNLLKAGAFKDPRFVQTTRDFIAVYLDGDTRDAQTWGEKLKAWAYPTLMVLNSKGEEVNRLITQASVPDLVSALKEAGLDAASLDELVRRAIADGRGTQITPAHWKRLAQVDWFVTVPWREEPAVVAKNLALLAAKAPPDDRDTKLSLEIYAIEAEIGALQEPAKLAPDRRQYGLALLEKLLKDPELLSKHAMEIVFFTPDFPKAFFPEENEDVARKRLARQIRGAFAKIRNKRSLTTVERVNLVYPLYALARGADEKFPALTDAEMQFIKTSLHAELRRAKTEQELSAILNTIGYAFGTLGAVDEAKAVLLKNVSRLKPKNEVYSSLAWLEASQANFDEALKYSAKAYEVASGAATRVQWGVTYLGDMIAYAPEQEAQIQELAMKVVAEALKAPDAFQGRSHRSLKKLASTFSAWAKKRKQALPEQRLRALEKEFCTSPNAQIVERCQAFAASFK